MTRLRAGAALLALLSTSLGAEVAVFRHATVYPVGGAVIDDGALLIEDGSIVRIGRSAEISLPAGARALELEDRVGSLEPGKDADFVVLSGEPFSTYTQVDQTWVEGEIVFDRSLPEHRRFATGGFDTYDARYHTLEGASD